MKPLRPEDIPRLWKWNNSVNRHYTGDTGSGAVEPSLPPFPESEDYSQFCEATGEDRNSETTPTVFRELFDLDSRGNIVGASMGFSGEGARPSLADCYYGQVRTRFQAVRPEDWSTRYNRISPWVGNILRDADGPWPKDDSTLKLSPYVLPVDTIAGSYGTGANAFCYGEGLVQLAVMYNFPEGDPDRTLLMESTRVHSADSQARELRWCRVGYDYGMIYGPELLVKLKPALLAYLEDLKDLTKGNGQPQAAPV